MKIAIVYDLEVRKDTTGVYCKLALEELGHDVTHFGIIEACTDKISHDFDFYLQVDDDFFYEWAKDYHPSAYWVIDGHRMDAPSSVHPYYNRPLQRYWRLVKMESFDYTFVAQFDKVLMAQQSQALIDQGKIISVLPAACDTNIHKPVDVPIKYDWCFVGNVIEPKRQRLLDALKAEFPNCFVGNAYFDEMAKIYSQSKIIFNNSLNNDVNMRIFEAMACGGLCVTNESDNLEKMFGEDVATYACVDVPSDFVGSLEDYDVNDCIDTFRYYLENERERKALAKKNLRVVRKDHTYKARMQEILNMVFKDGCKKKD